MFWKVILALMFVFIVYRTVSYIQAQDGPNLMKIIQLQDSPNFLKSQVYTLIRLL